MKNFLFDVLRTPTYVWFSFVTSVVGLAIWIIVRLVKMHSRRCLCGCWRVSRIHQMIPDPDARKLGGNYYQTFTFMPCRRCTEVSFKTDSKRFTVIELWWRRKFHPSQFQIDQDLFRRAGLCTPSSRSVRVPTSAAVVDSIAA